MLKLIYITALDKKEAEKIAQALVEERLAACVNMFPIKSIYRWRGKIEKADEIGLLVKTKAELADKIIKRVKELHSYEVPEIISLLIEKAEKNFLNWIDEETEKII